MKNNNAFELDTYINKGFFVEVFLSLIDRNVRDGSKTGKTRMTEKVATYRRLITKHKEAYFEAAKYIPPKLTNAQQIALYECNKIHTAYLNNLKAHFGNRLRMFLNHLCNQKEESSRLRKQMEKERYPDSAINDLIRRTVIQPCTKVKVQVAKKQIPTDNFLTPEKKNKIRELLSMYPADYTFQKDSIFYDVKANPTKHFKAWHKLTQMCQEYNLSSYHCYPLRCSFIPAYMTLDAKIINYHILKNVRMTEDKITVWDKACYLQRKAFKKQGKLKDLRFEGTIETDGIGASIIKQNFNTSRKIPGHDHEGVTKRQRRDADEEEEELKYIENLSREELIATQGECVLIDPNRRDLLYCMKETSTVEKKQTFRFTSNCRNKQSRIFKKLRKKTKPESIHLAETSLSKTKSFAVDVDSFVNYVKSRAVSEDLLYMYYGNETNLADETLYPHLNNNFEIRKTCNLYWGELFVAHYKGYFPLNINDQDDFSQLQDFIVHLQVMLEQKHIVKRVPIAARNCLLSTVSQISEWCVLPQENQAYRKKLEDLKLLTNTSLKVLQFLPFRKMRFSNKLFYLQNDQKLVKDLKLKFGPNAVLILGDWSAPEAKYHEPIRNKGMIKLLKKSGFSLYLVNEFNTSSKCPDCEASLQKFKKIKNPRPFQRKKMRSVTCNGLLKCKNHPSEKLFNRDMAAVLNFRNILFELRRTGERPESLRRSNTGKRKRDTNDNNKKTTKKTKNSA